MLRFIGIPEWRCSSLSDANTLSICYKTCSHIIDWHVKFCSKYYVEKKSWKHNGFLWIVLLHHTSFSRKKWLGTFPNFPNMYVESRDFNRFHFFVRHHISLWMFTFLLHVLFIKIITTGNVSFCVMISRALLNDKGVAILALRFFIVRDNPGLYCITPNKVSANVCSPEKFFDTVSDLIKT